MFLAAEQGEDPMYPDRPTRWDPAGKRLCRHHCLVDVPLDFQLVRSPTDAEGIHVSKQRIPGRHEVFARVEGPGFLEALELGEAGHTSTVLL